jgi:hypothetical protein
MPLENLPALYGTPMFITAFTRALHCDVSPYRVEFMLFFGNVMIPKAQHRFRDFQKHKLKEQNETELAAFRREVNHTSYQDTILSGANIAPVSQVPLTAVTVLSIIVIRKL